MPELQRALLFIMKRRLLLPDEINVPRRSSNRHQKNGPAITLPPDIAQRSSTVTFDGCQVGFVDGDGKPMKKPFKIMTNINELVNLLETKVCPGNHEHSLSRDYGSLISKQWVYPAPFISLLVEAVLAGKASLE